MMLEALSELTGTKVHGQDMLETLDVEGQERRQEARERIAAPSRQSKLSRAVASAPVKATAA
ncbi:hypothetical protein [Deinococcus ruber]|nr:hypothetical protein [Deinococcus ruber]